VLEFYLTSCSSTYVADIKDIYFVLKQEPSFFVYTQLSSMQDVPELADQTYSALSLVITGSNSV
jgi:hypothetical protein